MKTITMMEFRKAPGDDPLYPKQVVIEDGRPRCVAFHRIGAPEPIDPNAAVGDLFG